MTLPGYRGHIDRIEPVLAGWVAEIVPTAAPLSLLLAIDGREVAAAVADRRRADVAAAGLAGPRCGFEIPLPPELLDGAEHDLALRLPDGRVLALPGCPQRVALGPVTAALVASDEPDLEAVIGLLRLMQSESGLDPAAVAPTHVAGFAAIVSPDQGFLFYARAGSRLIGYCRLDRIGSGGEIGMIALAIVAAYRRKGLGEALLRKVLDAAAAEPALREAWLSVNPDNAPALRLYRKLGFRHEPRPAPPDMWRNAGEILMSLALR